MTGTPSDKPLWTSIRSHTNGLLVSVGAHRFVEWEFKKICDHVARGEGLTLETLHGETVAVRTEGDDVHIADVAMGAERFRTLAAEFEEMRAPGGAEG